MVSKKYIKGLEFNDIEEYFNYILDSEINGNRSQVRKLIDKMSKQQKKECIRHFQNDIFGSNDKNIVLELLHTSI